MESFANFFIFNTFGFYSDDTIAIERAKNLRGSEKGVEEEVRFGSGGLGSMGWSHDPKVTKNSKLLQL